MIFLPQFGEKKFMAISGTAIVWVAYASIDYRLIIDLCMSLYTRRTLYDMCTQYDWIKTN